MQREDQQCIVQWFEIQSKCPYERNSRSIVGTIQNNPSVQIEGDPEADRDVRSNGVRGREGGSIRGSVKESIWCQYRIIFQVS